MQLKLTQGVFTTIDDRDYDWLSKTRWRAHNDQGFGFYAMRDSNLKDGQYGKGRVVYMHRVIWEQHNGPIPKGMQIDHINGDRLDNRPENLRICTSQQNHFNQHKVTIHSSQFKGVCWYKPYSRWRAQIKIDGAHKNIGYFDTEEDAARASDAKAKELFGEFAKVNFS